MDGRMTSHCAALANLSAREWAISAGELSPTERLLLILLSDKVDRNFTCEPTLRTLAAESGAGRSTVLRRLRELEQRGLIRREPQFDEDGARLPTRYFLNHPLAPVRCGVCGAPRQSTPCSRAAHRKPPRSLRPSFP
ncbi:helix-turn-helix domain-containing protein [Mycobacterium camsae]|uniref:helix-turn-helix domain-containing protein n=1 Tax=Mycobacterium gordonae TaxID=1778 RepID=UPI0019819FD5|nr:helix-turn-helix domain-containing protein [Mycobacterium gordonae]